MPIYVNVPGVGVKTIEIYANVPGIGVRKLSIYANIPGVGVKALTSTSSGSTTAPPTSSDFYVMTMPSSLSSARRGTGSITSQPTTALSGNFTGNVSFFWSKVDGDNITITSPNSATTTFKGNVVSGDYKSATFMVTATDSANHTATATVTVAFRETGTVID